MGEPAWDPGFCGYHQVMKQSEVICGLGKSFGRQTTQRVIEVVVI